MGTSREQRLVQEALSGYEVSGELGRGAFGIVYLARHRQLGREVAVKQLPRAFAADPAVRERFVAEAQMVAGLDHPHIVPVYDFVDRDDGMCLIIMERCVGAISDRFSGEGMATDEACAAVLACCAALDHAHQAGVLHRDIKPENLLVDTAGAVKLGDFGIARALDSDARRTATGMVIGTPAYMSPEQVRGEDLTPAADVYSTGIMAYELLSGGFPFAGATSATGLLAHHLVTEPTKLVHARVELPAAIGEVVDRSLAKEADDRQQSAEEFALELTRACVGSFGAGWLRRRRFTLHWPEVIAESERPQEDGVRTGTIMVRADEARSLLAGARGAADDNQAPNATMAPTTSGPGTATTAPAPLTPPPGTSATVAPASQPQPAAPGPQTQEASATSPTKNRGLVLGGLGALTLLVLVVVLLASGGNEMQTALEQTAAAPTAQGEVGPTAPAPVATSASGELSPEAEAPTPAPNAGFPITPQRTSLETILVESPWAPSPCPIEPERVACIIGGVALDEATGEMIVPYEALGFIPELEPADFNLHFYLDTAVAGDERKAGAEVPGGSWKPWDGLGPFQSFGGENGRTGFTAADVQVAGATHLCVLVADADQVALRGTGNCAPIPQVFDVPAAQAQVNRLVGIYAGRCAIGATLILPPEWRWLDLRATEVAEAARTLRPGDVATTQAALEGLVSSGGLLWADGPVDDGYIINLNVIRIEGDYTSLDSPEAVRQTLAQSGLNFDGNLSERELLGRTLNVQVVQNDGFQTTQYLIPDFGYALLLNFNSQNVLAWQETSDAIAATLMGC